MYKLITCNLNLKCQIYYESSVMRELENVLRLKLK